ncbi:hypothetical protein HI914_02569 [Erysiphe necator]|nr:hypothetical protein HI914_02569 [Erysiphe necator]
MDPAQASQAPKIRLRAPRLTRDQRLQVLTLSQFGHKQKDIAQRLGITIDQVKKVVSSGLVSPRKSSGRPFKLSSAQVDELEEFVRSSREKRQMSYLELATNFPQWSVGEDAIRNALRRRGYERQIAQNKPRGTLVKTNGKG